VVNDSRSDNPDALSGVLTGASFVGGLAATAAAALTTDLGRNENRAKSLNRFLFAAGGPCRHWQRQRGRESSGR
jgi:hypothetical protein